MSRFMLITQIAHILNSVQNHIVVVGISVLLVIGIALIRKSGSEFHDRIVKKKLAKKNLVQELLETLNRIQYGIQKLMNEREYVEVFEIETLYRVKGNVADVTKLTEMMDMLENPMLKQHTLEYLYFVNYVVDELIDLEKLVYEQRKRYHEMVVFYNRKYNDLRESHYAEEEKEAIISDVRNEIKIEKDKLDELVEKTNELRKSHYSDLLVCKKHTIEIINQISNFKNREVDRKRVYLRYLSYI